MRRKMTLYIGGEMVDLDNQSFLLFTYTMEDLSNPTIVKNSISQQVTLPGTARNNKVFGDIFRNDRVTEYSGSLETGIYFDPTRKTSFVIHNELSEVVADGYCKLDGIKRKRNRVEYKVTLYGGLGSFLYGLAYDANGDKRSLADLDFGVNLDFTINRTAVSDAWARLGGDTSKPAKWDYINFAPCYNGKPTKPFDANKAVVHASTCGLPTADGDYTAIGGFSLVSLNEEVTEQEAQDYRSYLQRPVLRLKELIDAICGSLNNGGWTVNLDPDFTNISKPNGVFWDKAWISLPMLQDLNIDVVSASQTDNFNGGTYTIPGGGNLSKLYTIWVDFAMVGFGGNTDYVLHCEDDWAAGSPVNDNPGMYLNYLEWEVVAYDSADAVIDSFFYRVSTMQAPEGMTQMDDIFDYIDTGYTFMKGASVWKPKLSIQGYGIAKVKVTKSYRTMTWGNLRASGDANLMWPINTYDVTLGEYFSADAELPGSWININERSSSSVRTGASITQAQLLASEHTPADYLLSFCKTFGLVMLCHKGEKVVDILLRKNYYASGTDIDLTERVDRSKDIGKVPFAFDSRWYGWKTEHKGEWAEYYSGKYGLTYGQKRVNTGYEFNADERNLTGGIVFKGACDVVETSKYFCEIANYGYPVPSVLLAGGKQTLYKGVDESKDIDLPALSSYVRTWLNTSYPMHDFVPRPQFHGADNGHLDLRDVLLIYNGHYTPASNHITLSDDTRLMLSLNGNNPCWLPGYCDYDASWKVISMPRFNRGEFSGASVVKSLDWGTPLEAQMPGVTFASGSDVFSIDWKDYIADRYDDDSAVVTCWVDFRKIPVDASLLKNFYYFDNAVWALNKIINYSLTTYGSVQCEFVKVQDKTHYTS